MLTIFSTPRPFKGEFKTIQENAISPGAPSTIFDPNFYSWIAYELNFRNICDFLSLLLITAPYCGLQKVPPPF